MNSQLYYPDFELDIRRQLLVLWYNDCKAVIIPRINVFCVHRRNPALISVGDSMFLREHGIMTAKQSLYRA